VEFEFDPAKEARNLAQHKVSLALAVHVLATRIGEIEDTRRDYGERRIVAFGYLGARLHCTVYTMRGPTLRVISPRRANRKEMQRWQQGEA
jgi:uncharacterized protein